MRRKLSRCLRRWLRFFIVLTAVGPIASFYRLLYCFIAKLAIASFKRQDGLIALYLCRGLSKNQSTIVPGVSDIDFIIIVKDGIEHVNEANRLLNQWSARTFGVIEYYSAAVVTKSDFLSTWQTNPVRRFRLLEGQSTWTLATGTDVVNQLPALSELNKREAYYAELNYWWVRFVAMCFHDKAFIEEKLLRNSLCYKAVTEVSNLQHALQTGELVLHRERAFDREQGNLFQRVERQRKSRYLKRDGELVTDVLNYMMNTISDVWSDFSKQSFLTTHGKIVQNVISDEQSLTDSQQETMLEKIRKGFLEKTGFLEKSDFSEKLDAVDLNMEIVRSVWWQFDEYLLVVTLPAEFRVNAETITSLIEITREQTVRFPRCFLYLRVGDVLFPLTPEIPKDFYRGVITSATIPDVLLQLGAKTAQWTNWSGLLINGPEVERLWPSLTHQKREQLKSIGDKIASGKIFRSSDLMQGNLS